LTEKIKYWLDLSEYDLETAQAMLKSKRFLYVGFMCHQTIEKVLKAFYVKAKKKTPPYTHNLIYLAEISGLYTDFSEIQKDFLDNIQPFYIEARYPAHKASLFKTLTPQKCKQILEETSKIYIWTKQKL
jgi:HEPN domain-containing protein